MHDVSLSVQDGVGLVSLTAPERRNALTPDMAKALIEVCDQVDEDRSIGVLVITGGSFFCAGAHREVLTEIAKDPLSDWALATLNLIYEAFVRFGRVQVPTIAAIRGGAFGAGLNLALAADLRVVAFDARPRPNPPNSTLTSSTGGRNGRRTG